MKYLIFLGLVMLPNKAITQQCDSSPVLTLEQVKLIKQIEQVIKDFEIKTRKKIKTDKLDKAVRIYNAAVKHGINPLTLTSIVAHESGFNIKAVNPKTKDYGLTQINIYNIKARGLSSVKLTSNIDYSLETGALILAEFKAQYSKEQNWVCRYNIGTAKTLSPRQVKRCKYYVTQLRKWGYK
jgi:soluble lytic murein transglycosylase-like protein